MIFVREEEKSGILLSENLICMPNNIFICIILLSHTPLDLFQTLYFPLDVKQMCKLHFKCWSSFQNEDQSNCIQLRKLEWFCELSLIEFLLFLAGTLRLKITISLRITNLNMICNNFPGNLWFWSAIGLLLILHCQLFKNILVWTSFES